MREWYAKLAPRERMFVLIGGAAVAVMLLLGLIVPLNRSINQARQRVTHKQADLAFIQSAVPELSSAAPAMAAASPDTLVVLIDSSARESGLGKSLSSSQPSANGRLRIRLDKAPFDGLVAWLARLAQQHGVRVETAEIETAGEAGFVNASLELRAG